ncbi:DUF402 domain-containing protein [Streptomyces orinoci]|uniref:DUF402 domain-containing protein n=1 Tax=Streptomyces orinoci TaxID=67339 RepID=A0ABV3JZR2_STRON|nr:DUF402 domain-containing protein [Streptomyces orinoci]
MTVKTTHRFQPGATAIRRDIFQGRVWTAAPRRVLADTGRTLTLAHWPGVEGLAPTTYIDSLNMADRAAQEAARDRGFADLAAGTWELGRWQWRNTTVLSRFEAGEHFSVHLFFDAAHRPLHWYINFELPFVRTAFGIDTRDLLLDLVVEPDLSAHTWKDEDEYAQGRRLGIIDDAEHTRIESARERALALLSERQTAYFEGWLNWKPESGWPLPELPSFSEM